MAIGRCAIGELTAAINATLTVEMALAIELCGLTYSSPDLSIPVLDGPALWPCQIDARVT